MSSKRPGPPRYDHAGLIATIPLAVLALISVLILASNAFAESKALPFSAAIGPEISWDALPGWADDRHAEVWPALKNNCLRPERLPDSWAALCSAAAKLGTPDNPEARQFFEAHFTPHPVADSGTHHPGLITGYYEPLLYGSFQPGERYRYPLYRTPGDLLSFSDGLSLDNHLRGRQENKQVVPYYTRAEIETEGHLSGQELLWVDSLEDAFFLHVQGSGRVRLPTGEIVGVGFANHNGHPYVSIGKRLIERGALQAEELTLPRLRAWLSAHPEQIVSLLHENPRFIFFALRDEPTQNAKGALNVPLSAERSIAVDPQYVALGHVLWLSTTHPIKGSPYQRLVFAQDIGAAIKGRVRADLFWGNGELAERAAGQMNERGALFLLLPKTTGEE